MKFAGKKMNFGTILLIELIWGNSFLFVELYLTLCPPTFKKTKKPALKLLEK